MQGIAVRTAKARCTLPAVVLVIIIGSGSLGAAPGSGDAGVDEAQRAVREQITSDVGNVAVRFADDARTDSRSNTNRRVRGSGTAVRDGDGKLRSFAYEAVVNTRNSQVSDVHHDWRGDWLPAATDRLTGTDRLPRGRS